MKPLIVANWKMNPVSLSKAEEMVAEIEKGIDGSSDVVVAPPYIFLDRLSRIVQKTILGAQDAYFEDKGSFTGEISSLMLKELGVRYLILGHSERRKIFKEDRYLIKKKIEAALENGLSVILCIGEEEGEDPKELLTRELVGVDPRVIIAYEPVWAIGSGRSPEAESIKEIPSLIGQEFRVIYGGSVNSSNYKNYLRFFSGLLVGGASLDPEEFIKITRV